MYSDTEHRAPQANEGLQNLVPLLSRPLGLVLPPETLRSARIVLLKATHWPPVALILGYESWRLYLERRHNAHSPSPHGRGPNSPSSLHRPFSGRWVQQKASLATGARTTQLAGEARAARTPVPAPQETRKKLEAAVANLKAQIETISSMIEKDI